MMQAKKRGAKRVRVTMTALATGEHVLVPTSRSSAIAWSGRIGKRIKLLLVPVAAKKVIR